METRTQILVISIMSLGIFVCIVLFRNRFEKINQIPDPRISRQVTDATSRKILIPSNPKRILSLCTSATDTMMRLGASDQLAAIDEYSRIVPGASDKVIIGKGSAMSKEQVLSLNIDLAIIWWYQDDVAHLLQDLSVPVVRIRSGRSDELSGMIRLIGDCVNKAEIANHLASKLVSKLEQLDEKSSTAPSVYLELYGAYKTVGRSSLLNDLIELSGGRNIVTNDNSSVLISIEYLLQEDPDVILFVNEFATTNSIIQRSGWGELSAVRKGHIYAIDRSYLIGGAGLPDAAIKIRALLSTIKHVNQ